MLKTCILSPKSVMKKFWRRRSNRWPLMPAVENPSEAFSKVDVLFPPYRHWFPKYALLSIFFKKTPDPSSRGGDVDSMNLPEGLDLRYLEGSDDLRGQQSGIYDPGGWKVGISKLWTSRSRVYRRRFLRLNTRWKALHVIYKIYMLLHRSDRNISANIRPNFRT